MKTENIQVGDVVITAADLVIGWSVVSDKEFISKLEEVLGSKLEGAFETELLGAQLFMGQVALLDFLTKREFKAGLTDFYVREIFELLLNKYEYFSEGERGLFQNLLANRWPEYFDAINQGSGISESVADALTKNFAIKNVIVTAMLSGSFASILTTLSDYLSEIDAKYKLVIGS